MDSNSIGGNLKLRSSGRGSSVVRTYSMDSQLDAGWEVGGTGSAVRDLNSFEAKPK